MSPYPAFPKIPRLRRSITITEKIDGTNGLISVEPGIVRAGSRNRWITPQDDNFGFAAWVQEHAEGLSELGLGLHYGEWWGAGIQRGYGIDHKRFSLFNSLRWTADARPTVPGLDTVPVLYSGEYADLAIGSMLRRLRDEGSEAAPGFMNPEGVVVWHTASRSYFKVLIDNDGEPKNLA